MNIVVKKPLISIITVVFNGAESIESTIRSVIFQNYDFFEYIIIDGFSNDGTIDIIKKYECHLDYWISEKDNGIYDAMNKGLGKINGDWFLFLNSGDTFVSNNVLLDVSLFFISPNSNYYGIADIFYKDKFLYKKPSLKKIDFSKTLPIHQTIFISSRFKDYCFDSNYKIVSDSMYIFNLSLISSFDFVPITIAKFHLGGISSWYNNFGQFKIHLMEHLFFIQFKKGRAKEIVYALFAFSFKFFLSLFLSKSVYYKLVTYVAKFK
jgi:putative colanic acid biosynthesis glycosyltransferase